MSDRDQPRDPHGRPIGPPPAYGQPPAPTESEQPPAPPAYGQPPASGQPTPPTPHGQQPSWQRQVGRDPQAYGPGGYPPGGLDAASTAEERNWAMASHVGAFAAAYVALGLLAPLIVLLVKGNDSRFVRRHAVESLNFQLSVLVYLLVGSLVAVVLVFATFGLGIVVVLPAALAFALAYLVLVIIGTVKASRGQEYRYPLTLRLVT